MLKDLIRKDKQFIFNFAAVIGVGLTMATTIKATTKACKLVDDKMSTKEKIKKTWKFYIPPTMVAATTMLCIIYSDTVAVNQKMSLLSALIATQNKYRDLRQGVDEVCDPETREEILKRTVREKVPKELYIERTEEKIFWEEYSCKFFTSTIDNVLKAEYLFNKQLSVTGMCSLNEFYDMLGIKKTEAGEYLGWSVYDGYYGVDSTKPWVDFEHRKMIDDDGCEYYYLSYSNQPEINYDMLSR
jgi:hypothetical protein